MISIFPEHMLDGSIHTAVLLGIVCLWLLTESLGFVFAGFVVAGYLAALGVVAPMSLAAIALEAVLTYGLVHAVGRVLPDRGWWAHTFGRERFLLFLVASIPVRLVVEGLAAPTFELWLQPLFEDPLWRGSRFFGIGVVLVPLLANAFWKVGLARGALQVGTTTTVTWAALVFVVQPLTNFHLGGFELTFEDVAIHFLAVPKIYVVLVITAAVAARNNVRFGWDFGGILVPALLAIVAFSPAKLLSTAVEVVLLVWAWRALVSLPWVRDLELVGPRRIVTMYALSYALKWVVAVGAGQLAPWLYVSDLYGFGYLLTSLVAVRCVEKGHTARTLVALGVTTGQGLALALAVSLGLSALLPGGTRSRVDPGEAVVEIPLERAVLLAHASVRVDHPDHPGAATDRAALARLVRRLARGGNAGDLDQVSAAWRSREGRVEWATRADGTRCLGLRSPRASAAPPSGVASTWWCGGPGPVLLVPQPLADPDSLWATAWLAHRSGVAGVVVAGVDTSTVAPLTAGHDRRALRRLARLRDVLGDRAVLVVRSTPAGESTLDPRSAATLSAVAGHLGPLEGVPARFDAEHGPLWDDLGGEDGTLTVSVSQVARLTPAARQDTLHVVLAEGEARPESLGPVYDPATRLTAAEVLLGAAMRWTDPGVAEPGPLAWLGQVLGVEVIHAVDARGRAHWVLDEGAGSPRGWGTWVLRPGGTWVVVAPFSREERGTAGVAGSLYARLDARGMWLSRHGTRHGFSSALSRDLDELPLEPLAVRTALRPGLEGAPHRNAMLVRAQPSAKATPWQERPEGLVLSTGHELVGAEDRAALDKLLDRALWYWPGVGYEDGRPETSSLAAFGQHPVKYLNALSEGHTVVTWFAPDVLAEVEGSPDHAGRRAWYATQGVAVVQVEEVADLLASVERDAPVQGPQGILEPLRHHVETLDDASLRELSRRAEGRVGVLTSGLRFTVLTWDAHWLCAAVAGARDDDVRFPLNGCWQRAAGREP